MATQRLFLVILLASVVMLATWGISAQLDAAPSAAALQGRVYSGNAGDESTPLAGVVVSAYGANDPYPVTGTLIVTATTDGAGWYSLEVPEDFEYYSIQETTPAGYTSAGATSVSGTVRTADWIEYAAPLNDKTLSGNKFWDAPPAPAGIPLAEVPTGPYRQAAQVIEHARGSGTAPGWEQVQLGLTAYPLYRPDVSGVAYYEFRVVRGEEPAGFIVVSTGGHDFPIPHWNFVGESLTQELERKAQDAGRPAARFYKLDALSYAAEDAAGQLASTLGGLPQQVIGVDPAWLSQTVELSGARWTPSHPELGDDQPSPDGTLTVSGPVTPSWQLREWGSWGEMKAGYALSYTILLEALRRDAAPEWEIESLIEQYGEGLRQGQVYTLALLCDSPAISLSGAGVAHVQAALVTRPGLPSVYRIAVTSAVPGQELSLDIAMDCPDRAPETFKFAIGEPAAKVYLPMVGRNVSSQPSLRAQGVEAVQQNWDWYWAWAGTEHQRMYSQMAANTGPNTSDCWSGCGATAWAMLFGWADYEATNPAWNYWSGRWGIYRENGGYGNDAVAPVSMDSGVQNMIWEIRGHIDTWCACLWGMCISDGGATFPSDMDEAADYLKGRTNVSLDTHYNVFGWTEGRLREYARDSILYRKTPAIIGTGWLKHYPLAYGYQWWSKTVKKCFIWCWNDVEYNRMFWVNQGWGNSSSNGWITARTWFAGEIYP
ncbi:MAG: hypothetical protein JW850_18710 [Thermoflexales bacterium]|nr:hypothetical protein [Thermoflexales bacterium]